MADESTTPEPASAGEVIPEPDSVLPGPVPVQTDTGYTPSGVPTLEGVREKIEARLGTALGATELAEETPEVRAAAERYADRQKAAAEKLEQIRDSMPKAD